MNKPLIIFGSAEVAELAKFYFVNDSNRKVIAFTVDDEYVAEASFCGLPMLPFSEISARYPAEAFDMHIAISYGNLNRLRQEKYNQAKAAGYALASYVCSKSTTWPDLQIGDNCFILEDQTIQPTVRIGNNVMMWSGNHIGHGVQIADHTYVSSHVVISGHCSIGRRCFLGVNATLKDFCNVGDDCFIAMGAEVGRDMPNGAVALGSQADIYGANDRRAQALKRRYFKL